MAGASVAYELAGDAKVLVLEREAQPGYHATGRSAAVYIPSYGDNIPALRLLTRASYEFFTSAPETFHPGSLLRRRGMLSICHEERVAELEAGFQETAPMFPQLTLVGADFIRQRVPVIAPEYAARAMFEPDVFDIDVYALHDAYLRGVRRAGAEILFEAEIKALSYANRVWRVRTESQSYSAPLVVNAAGAWVDTIAELAGVNRIGIQPLRRTAVLLDPPDKENIDDWPVILDQGGQFYFKPDAGLILASPADETPSPPCDAQPEELDIAYAAHYAEQALQLRVRSVKHSWAGLRSFVEDRSPVIGFAPDASGFFWFAGQGGHGIQIAPAAARLAASMIRGEDMAQDLRATGFAAAMVSPQRLAMQRVDEATISDR